MSTFDDDVLTRSSEIPVLVDFWAPWCGPCRVLGPVLERLAEQQEGRWELVKVNTDENPELSAQYGIRGIPAVKLFVDGEVVDEFTGALPEPAVKQWLDKAIPGEAAKRIQEAEEAMASGDDTRASALLEQVLADSPTNPRASGLLARILVWTDPERANSLAAAAATGEADLVRLAASTRELSSALTEDPSELPDGPGKESFTNGLEAIRKQDLANALEALIHVINVDRYYADDRARKLVIALFEMLGDQHDITKKYRRQFDMSLY